MRLVPGEEPAICVEGGAFRRVFAGHLGATHPQIAARAGFHAGTSFVADLDFHAGQGAAHRAQAGANTVFATLQCAAMVVRPEQGNRGTGLRQSVRVHEIDVRQRLERLLQYPPADRRTAIGDGAQVVQPMRASDQSQLVYDAAEHRRHEHRMGDSLLAGDL